MKGLRYIFSILKSHQEIVLLTILMCFSIYGLAQSGDGLNPKKRPSQYILKSWDTEDGLASESTNDLIQTPDGYIWVGTYTGLHRFDGKEFTVYNSQNSALPSSNILCLDLDSNGVLWLGTLHGLACYDKGKIFIPKKLQKVAGYSTETMLVTANDEVWFSTKSNQLFQYTGDSLINYTEKLGLQHHTVQTIAQDAEGTVFFGTADSQLISYTSRGDIHVYNFPEATNGINRMTTAGSRLYIGTGRGLYTFENNLLKQEPYLDNTAIMSLYVDSSEVLWLGTMRGLFRYEAKEAKLDSITEQTGLPNNIIRDILLDDRGNLWGGTYRSGIFYLSDGSITSYSKNDGLESDIITGVAEIAPGKYLLGNENGKLNLLSDDKISEFEPSMSLPNARLKHLFIDNKNRIWVSTYAGLYMLDGKESRSYTTSNGFPDNFIRKVFQDNMGSIWIGTKNAGLIKFNSTDSWEQIGISDGMTSDYIMDITGNDQQELIVNTISGINIIKDMKVIRTITLANGLPSNFSFSSITTPNFIWIASNDGLTAISGEKVVVFNSEKGLPFNIIYDVLTDNDGNLWLPGEKAILKLSLKNLEDKFHHPDTLLRVEVYDKGNGMKNNHCLGGVLSYTDSKGDFWIPTLGGIVNIRPREIKNLDYYGVPIIENVMADNQLVSIDDPIKIPPQTNRLNVEFTGINFEQSDKLQFRYMLKPFDNHWINTQGNRNALYTNLPPGKYEFWLQAGIENEFFNPVTTKKITIFASWWQTVWAQVLYVLIAVGLGFFIYWIRLRNLTSRNSWLTKMVKSRTEELENQKHELTQALQKLSEAQAQVLQSEKMASLGLLSAGVAHEINNPLNFIKSGSHILQKILGDYLYKGLPLNERDSSDVRMLLENIEMGSDRIKQIVSSLSLFSRGNQNEFKSCYLEQVIDSSLTILQHEYRNRIMINKRFDSDEMVVWGNEGKLYQIFINLISNSIHAIKDPGEISFHAYYEGSMTKIEIADTGSGISKEIQSKVFDPFFTTKEAGKGTGLGMSIIYSIVSEHKGEINFDSEPGKGTVVYLSLPTNQNSSTK